MLIMMAILFACNNTPVDVNAPAFHYSIKKIGECEYIEVNSGGDNARYSLTHRGDCPNPKHYFRSNTQFKYTISMPDENILFSTDENKPDTLIGYASRDTVYFKTIK